MMMILRPQPARQPCRVAGKDRILVTGDLSCWWSGDSGAISPASAPITAGEKPDLDQRLAAEHSADTDRADDVAENVGLDRQLASSRGRH